MATTLTGGNGTDVILPEGVTADQVGVRSTADGETLVVIKEKTADLTLPFLAARPSDGHCGWHKGDTTKLLFETSVFQDSTISNEGKGALEVNLNDGS